MNVRRASSMTRRSGFITRRTDDVLAVAEDLVHRDQVARRGAGRRRRRRRRAAGRRARAARTAARRRARAALAAGKTLSSHQRATSGNESSRSVSPVGAQSTMMTSKRAVGVMARICSRLNSSSMPGRDGQLLGGDPVDAALEEHLAEPVRTARPVALDLVLGLDLLAQSRSPTCSAAAPSVDLERVAEAVRGVGRDHERREPGGGAAARRRGGDGGLADAALAGVEDRPGRHAGRRSLWTDWLRRAPRHTARPGCALWRPSNNLARLYAPLPPVRRGLAVPAGPVHPDRRRVRDRARRRRPDVLHLDARRDPDGGAHGQGDRGARGPRRARASAACST